MLPAVLICNLTLLASLADSAAQPKMWLGRSSCELCQGCGVMHFSLFVSGKEKRETTKHHLDVGSTAGFTYKTSKVQLTENKIFQFIQRRRNTVTRVAYNSTSSMSLHYQTKTS